MDVRQILSDAGISAVRSVVTSAMVILLVPVITNLMGADAFGIWKTLLALISLLVVFGGFNLHSALIRYLEPAGDSQTFSDLFLFTVLLGLAAIVLIPAIAWIVYSLYPIASIPIVLLVPTAIIVGLRIPGNVLKNFLRARQRVKLYEIVGTGQTLCNLCALVSVLWITRSLESALWILAAIDAVVNLGLFVRLFPNLSWPELDNFGLYFDYSVPLIPQQLASKLLHDADKFLIIALLGPTPAGFYAVVYTVARVIQSATNIFNSTLYPRVTTAWDNGELDELSRFYTIFSRWYIVVVIPATVGLVIVGGDLIRLISTAEIARNSVSLLPALVIATAFQGLETPLTYILSSAERTRLIAGITLGVTAANLVLNLALIPAVGIFGAAVATLVAYCGRVCLLYYYSNQYVEIRIKPLYILKSIVASSVMAVVLFVVPNVPPIWTIIMYPILGAAVFATVLVGLDGLSERDRSVLGEWVPVFPFR